MTVNESAARQVSHWLHDEQACVTVQRIVQTFNLSWTEASSLLQGVPKEGCRYTVVRYASHETQAENETNDNSEFMNIVENIIISLHSDMPMLFSFSLSPGKNIARLQSARVLLGLVCSGVGKLLRICSHRTRKGLVSISNRNCTIPNTLLVATRSYVRWGS